MNPQITEQLGFGALAIALGISGWLLPYRWNLLRLHRSLAKLFSDHVNQAIPKVLGSICIVVGIALLGGTAIIGRFR